MRTSFLLVAVVVISALLALDPIKLLSLSDASMFFMVIGVTYGVVSAFAINDVDKSLDQLRDSFGREASALKSIYLLAKRISDNAAFRKIQLAMLDYCRETIDLDLSAYEKDSSAHLKFHSLLGQISSIKIKNRRDDAFFSSIIEEAKIASNSRDEQIILTKDRLPKIQWVLEVFLSMILIIILTIVVLPDGAVSTVVEFLMLSAILLTLVVIYELDSMNDFEDEISNEPYRKLIALIEKGV